MEKERAWRYLKLAIWTLAVVALWGCSGDGSGGEPAVVTAGTDNTADISPRTFIIENADGGEMLQAALDRVRAGDTVIIRAGAHSYRGNYRFPGETLRGFTLASSGTAEAPIRILGEAVPGYPRPVIDQGKTLVHDPAADESGEPTLGLYLLCASHVVIDNLEIRHAHLGGISTSLGACDSTGLRIENNHIHHIHGDRNVAAIRLSRASEVVIRNNDLHDVYQTDSDRAEVLITGNQPAVTAVHVEHNRFTNMHTGVRLHARNDKSLRNIVISHNHFENLDSAVAGMIDNGDEESLADATLQTLTLHDNLFLNLLSGITIDAGNSSSQSSGLTVYNNTFYQLDAAALLFSGLTAVSVYNNIFSLQQRDLLISRAPANALLDNALAEHDYNLYWHIAYSAATGPEWLLDLGGSQQQLFDSFTAWQQAFTHTLHPQLSADPDQASQFLDPLFIDVENRDFTPGAGFALSGGRHGEALGAFRHGERPGLEE